MSTPAPKVWLGTLREYLRLALRGEAPPGWSYVPDSELTLDSGCVAIDGGEDTDEEGVRRLARGHGCGSTGLDAASTEDTVEWVRQFEDPPSDALMLESFVYYREADAFLPEPGAVARPAAHVPWEVQQRESDRQFYAGLGPESPASPCREPGCKRGSLAQSLFCRPHHFEMLKKRPCPFLD